MIFNHILDLIAPPRCMSCVREGSWLCQDCRQHLPPVVATCIGCGEQSPRGLVCSSCRSDYTLAGVVSAGPYHHPAFERGIGWLKYKGVRAVVPDLAALLVSHLPLIAPIPELIERAVLVPIPLHQRRLRQRGFNQSDDLAQAMSRYTGIPVLNLLTRTKATWTQSQLPHDLRTDNTRDAFSLAAQTGLPDRPLIILIDDVTTTGATLDSAARALRKQLPQSTRIWAATVARG